MSKLENDALIVDAILTDEGRRRIAAGNFTIAKFAFSDDEIVYSKAQQASSSVKFQNTPILEATSENTRALKYKLLSLDGDYTFLNSTRLVTDKSHAGTPQASSPSVAAGKYVIISTKTTYDNHYGTATDAVSFPNGYIPGYDVTELNSEQDFIKIDHGINNKTGDNVEYGFSSKLPAELSETEFMVKLDHRIARLVSPDGSIRRENTLDDDFIATYVITSDEADYIESVPAKENSSPISGARGLRLKVGVIAAPSINTSSDTIWNELGRDVASFFSNGTTTGKIIETVMEVQGMTTNLNITVPLVFVKNA